MTKHDIDTFFNDTKTIHFYYKINIILMFILSVVLTSYFFIFIVETYKILPIFIISLFMILTTLVLSYNIMFVKFYQYFLTKNRNKIRVDFLLKLSQESDLLINYFFNKDDSFKYLIPMTYLLRNKNTENIKIPYGNNILSKSKNFFYNRNLDLFKPNKEIELDYIKDVLFN